MMKPISTIFLCVFTILLASCGSSNEVENWDEFKVYYFDFDEVEYYQAHVSEASLSQMRQDKKADPKTKRFGDILEGNVPKSIADTSFLQELDEFGFEYQIVPESKHYELNDLFREKSADPSETKIMDMSVYSSILVFKNENQIVGIAKVCFGSSEIQIVGTDANTDRFGSCLGYRKLSDLLRRE
ncbi:MAG: hypothetical protein GQ574_09055 [Crocinitomix sp.]|nr:hypothetical protein [Crocinitomix sp.]